MVELTFCNGIGKIRKVDWCEIGKKGQNESAAASIIAGAMNRRNVRRFRKRPLYLLVFSEIL